MTGRKLYQNRLEDDELDIILIIGNGINFIKKNLKTLILFSVIGLLGGIGAFYLLPRVYNISMLADSRLLSSQEVISIADSWQDLLKKGEIGQLAKKFNLSPSFITNIKSIEAEQSKKNIGAADKDAFLITAKVYNNDLLDSLQAGILYSLKNNEYVRQRVEIQRSNLNLLRNKINGEITELDSIKASIQKLLNKNNTSTAFLTEPGNINSTIVELYEKALQIDETIKFIDEIQVIESFTRFEKPDSPKLIICLMGGFILGLLIAVLYIMARNIQVRLKELPA